MTDKPDESDKPNPQDALPEHLATLRELMANLERIKALAEQQLTAQSMTELFELMAQLQLATAVSADALQALYAAWRQPYGSTDDDMLAFVRDLDVASTAHQAAVKQIHEAWGAENDARQQRQQPPLPPPEEPNVLAFMSEKQRDSIWLKWRPADSEANKS
ncbi:MAG TPA: hypothetical protein VGP82_06585 [Ktedonobacterales bacterium]|jgi:hypothetical protein|nr:hypothetical protein [Ktedonobacterales bacterium]